MTTNYLRARAALPTTGNSPRIHFSSGLRPVNSTQVLGVDLGEDRVGVHRAGKSGCGPPGGGRGPRRVTRIPESQQPQRLVRGAQSAAACRAHQDAGMGPPGQLGFEQPREGADVLAGDVDGTLRRRVAPQAVDHPVPRHRPVRLHEKECQQRPLLR